jgi:hypothetical protein
VRVTYAQLDADTSKHALHTFTAARSFWPGNKSSGFRAPQHDEQNIFFSFYCCLILTRTPACLFYSHSNFTHSTGMSNYLHSVPCKLGAMLQALFAVNVFKQAIIQPTEIQSKSLT